MSEFDNDQLRPEELHGGFDVTDDEAFSLESATLEASASVQSDFPQSSESAGALDEAMHEYSSERLSAVRNEPLHHEPLQDAADAAPAASGEAVSESPFVGSFDGSSLGDMVDSRLLDSSLSDNNSEALFGGAPTEASAGVADDLKHLYEAASPLQAADEPLRFGFDEPHVGNQRIPPLPQKSAWARNGIALALTGGLSLLTAAIAWYMLTMQAQGIQAFFHRLMGRQQANVQSTFEHSEQGNGQGEQSNQQDNEQTATSAESAVIADSLSSSGSSVVTSANGQASVASDLERIDSLNAALMSKMEMNATAKQSESSASQRQATADASSSKLSSALSSAPSTAVPTVPSGTASNRQDDFSVKSGTSSSSSQEQLSSTLQSAPQSSLQQRRQRTQMQQPVRQTVQQKSKSGFISTAGRFAVQVYSTISPFEAERMRRRLQIRRLPQPKVVPADLGDRFVYRVRFGSYATQREAQRAALLSGLSETLVVQTR